jgi:16S rRNA (uracil1498-N3)-methyltransferase
LVRAVWRGDNPPVLPRFHAPALLPGASSVTLDAEESHHLVHVIRLRQGARVRTFDGLGHEWEGAVASLDKRGAVIDGLEPVAPLPEPGVAIAVIAGLVRGAAMDILVRDTVMLGACEIVPVHAERSSVSRKPEAQAAALARWRRIAVGACKQCGRATVPAIRAPEAFTEVAARAAAVKLMLVEPTAPHETLRRLDEFARQAREGGATIAIGPEGGWSPAEFQLASHAGFRFWSLGPSIMRAENVPVAALSIARYAWEGE